MCHGFHISGAWKSPVGPVAVPTTAGTATDRKLLPPSACHAAAGLAQPLAHKDPFDTLLLVQAQAEARRLPTRGGKLAGHPLALVGGQG